MKAYLEKENCCGCTACASICPTKAITMEVDEKGFMYPSTNESICVNCSLCRKVCAFHELDKKIVEEAKPKFYAMQHKDINIRMSSSSGGAFTALSDYILINNGVIYGACFDEKFVVRHIRVETFEEREALKGSKYVQSDMRECLSKVKEDLINERLVLFVGTPCQVAGVKSFLKREYKNLILVDFACHGTPSPKIWKDYIAYLEEGCGDKVKGVNFRNKENGWKVSTLEVKFEKTLYTKDKYSDGYYNLFLKNYIIRDACHHCPYTNFAHPADITIADFWGIETKKPHLDDDTGTSLLIINSLIGFDIFSKIKNDFIWEEAKADECLQAIFRRPSYRPKQKDQFWNEYAQYGLVKVIDTYGKTNKLDKIKFNIILPIIRKMGLYNIVLKIFSIIHRR